MIRLTTELSERVHGFHPTLRTTVTVRVDERDALEECAAGLVYAAVPGTVIVDRYQLRVLYEEGRLSEPTAVPTGPLDLLVWADGDLEGPASRPDPPQPGGLLVPLPLHLSSDFSMHIPLHLRYLPPIVSPEVRPVRDILIEPPVLVKWCNQSTANPSESTLPAISPATIRLLSETFSTPHRPLSALSTDGSYPSTPIRLSVPVGVQDDELLVQIITAATVWLAFVWICSCLMPNHSPEKTSHPSAASAPGSHH
ncbi:hypothetical protein PTTG_28481 [Puccinia triticina 1-1 BBBD Race 1]|uniref:Protein PBN1 n=2 Tax=Puccinia triticina TaxID=208348 RepID=A0A180GB62_PUCT1|nr:uncharacterized protein PtA15_14A424 [Puccinia triticina]OAV89917.1 hypothetical protein PTTG_28481 [Puccinia triticina 1-1 BBBD Race 1]WAQ91540.1 hypothetical protein PtA15_14A424 [Puccinia triticina]WAR62342.1 hypothetical protein PtB15_14B437 [Puccinia triticina]